MPDDQYRGLLTAREREILRGDADVSSSYYSRVRTRVRNKIELFEEDMEILSENEPQLASELRDSLCDQ